MTSDLRHQLCALQQSGHLDALETRCKELLLTETDTMLRGCLLWNLSDIHAIRREATELYENHRLFETHVQTMPAMYRLWLVSDATQRLALELGGYGGFWWNVYEDATAEYSVTCEAVLFEAHRAAFYKSPNMPYNHKHALWVKERFGLFLQSAGHSSSAAYYRLVFTALFLKHFGEAEQDVFGCCESFLDDLRHPTQERLYVPGEWDALNRRRSRSTQAQVGINHAVNALIDCGNVRKARELYTIAREHGLAADNYIEQRM